MTKNYTYATHSIYSFVISGLCYFIYCLSTMAGYLTLHGANNMTNAYGLDRNSTQEIFNQFFKYQTEFFNQYFHFTIGHFNNLFGALAIFFILLAVIFAIKQIRCSK